VSQSGAAAALPPLLLVGCGKMGGAMLEGWLERGAREVVVVEPHADAMAGFHGRVTACADAASVPKDFRPGAIVLATKPQQAEAALPAFAAMAGAGALVLSIMAGKTAGGVAAMLGGAARVVRAMPNTPAAVRQGFTCAFARPGVTPDQRELADALLTAIGEVAWVEDEAMIDPVTAVSGGGPAYVFLLAELLEQTAIEQGLPPELARRMARRTVSGSGALLAASDLDAAQLRRNVTSPRGTTEQALQVLMAADAWPRAMSEAIAAATRRSRELGG
jgi:pyrroline-5-carboxylate reductase